MSSPDASSSPSPTTPWQLQARMLGLHQGQTTIKVSTFESNCNQLLYSPVMRGAGAKVAVSSHGHSAPQVTRHPLCVLPTFSATPANFEIQSTRVQKSASPQDIGYVCRFSRGHGQKCFVLKGRQAIFVMTKIKRMDLTCNVLRNCLNATLCGCSKRNLEESLFGDSLWFIIYFGIHFISS